MKKIKNNAGAAENHIFIYVLLWTYMFIVVLECNKNTTPHNGNMENIQVFPSMCIVQLILVDVSWNLTFLQKELPFFIWFW